MVPIGAKTNAIVAGDNAVTVSGLVKAGQVVATQTIGGQESCVPQASQGYLLRWCQSKRSSRLND
jgi:hypothetical protein